MFDLNKVIGTEAPVERIMDTEEYGLAVEAQVIANLELQQTGDQLGRLEASCLAMEALADIGKTITEATPAEVALATVATESVFRFGLEQPGLLDDATVATESSVGGTLATEGLRDWATSIWRAIVDFCKELWKKAEKFFYNMFGTLPTLVKALEKLQAKAEKKFDATQSEGKTTIGREANSISLEGKAPKNFAEFEANLSGTTEVLENFIDGKYGKSLTEASKTIGEAAEGFEVAEKDGDDANTKNAELVAKGIKAFAGVLETAQGKLKLEKVSPSDKRFKGQASHRSLELIGGQGIFVSVATGAKDVTELAKALDSAHSDTSEEIKAAVSLALTLDVRSFNHKAKDALTEATVETWTPAQVVEFCGSAINTVQELQAFERGSDRKDFEKGRSEVEKSIGKLSKSLDKQEDISATSKRIFKTLTRSNTLFNRLASQPIAGVSSAVLAGIRGGMVVSSKSLSNYK